MIQIEIEDFDKVVEKLKKSPEKLAIGIHTAIGRTVQTFENKIKKEAPVNKRTGGGNLRQSIKSKVTGVASGQVEVGAHYGIYVEKGTRPHFIFPKRKRALANKRTNQMFGRMVRHPGTQANPFFTRGIQASLDPVGKIFTQLLRDTLK